MPGCWVRSISAHAAVVADKTISLHVTQPLVSKVVHDKFPFVHEVVANGPRLCIVCLSNLLMRMRSNGHSCTSALNIECKIKFSVHCFVQNLIFWQFFCHVLDQFGHFWCTCAETPIKLLSAKFLTPYLKFPSAVSYSKTNFGGTLIKN